MESSSILGRNCAGDGEVCAFCKNFYTGQIAVKKIMLSFRTRIFCSVLVVALLATAVAIYYGRSTIEQMQIDATRESLLYEVSLAAALLRTSDSNSQGMAAVSEILRMPERRLTLMDGAGNVLLDTSPSARDAASLDNHADRPEVAEAMQGGTGFAIRPSATVKNSMAYVAIRVDEGRLLRVAVPLLQLQQAIESRRAVFTRIGIAVLLCSLVLAMLLSQGLKRSLEQMVSVVEAISLGHFHRRLRRIPGQEFVPLADAVNRMADNIDEHVRITEEQTAQLETILETMTDGVLVLGPRGRIRRCNSALARDFPDAADALGAQVVEVIPSPDLQEAVDSIMTVGKDAQLILDTGSGEAVPDAASGESAEQSLADTGRRQNTLQLDLPSGQVFAVCISRPATTHKPGRSGVGAVVVFHDITELMRLERVRRDFVANVSHELRTPLTAIQGYAETLISLDCPPECQRFAKIILKNSMCLSRMVEDLLSLARLEGQPGSLELVPVDPHEAVQQALNMCRDSLKAKGVKISVDIPENARVMASQPHLSQVFRNLMENAMRFTPASGTIRISAHQGKKGLVFRVVDDGPGIPPNDLERIFERFYQVERHRGQGSSGLGLAICKHIIERHGSHIRAESPAVDGSTAFVFTLTSA
jgi:two-component system phosphate regulon sensor histidine kinase PhoR